MVIGAAVPRGIAGVALAAALWTSCASPQAAGGPNADCFRVEDCKEGLVCIQKKCSKDLSKIMGESPMAIGGMGGAGGAVARDGAPDGTPASPGDGAPAGGAPAKGGATGNGGSATSSGGTVPKDGGASG